MTLRGRVEGRLLLVRQERQAWNIWRGYLQRDRVHGGRGAGRQLSTLLEELDNDGNRGKEKSKGGKMQTGGDDDEFAGLRKILKDKEKELGDIKEEN